MYALQKTRFAFSQAACVALLFTLLSCGTEEAQPDATIADASLVDATIQCVSDDDCNDGLFCTGTETCSPAGQCQSGITMQCNDGIACTIDECSNVTRGCEFNPPDVDQDGHRDSSCLDDDGIPLGDDCDDFDENRFPGNVEFCDAADLDEDCNPDTFGIVDVDNDGFPSANCCNFDALGTAICGNDCDDTRDNIHLGVTEACDGLDNDCNGLVDDGVLIAGFFDGDGDGYGDDTQPLNLCAGQAEFAVQGGDCDDATPATNPGQLEFCDGIDNDCNTLIDDDTQSVPWYLDSDGDLFGDPNVASIISCAPIAGRSVLNSDCDDDAPGINPSSQELCDGLDNDCNGLADFQIGINDFEDDDGDGLVDIACSPLGIDCDDTNPVTGPGTIEQCDGQDNDCDGNVDENVALTLWYRDLDSDGFGSISSGTLVSCEQPLGYSSDGSDCDDNQSSVNTDGEETCNSFDDDCDGTNNEEPAASSSCPPIPGGTPLCENEACSFRCIPGQADCDGINNDCEIGISADADNCGACGISCAPGANNYSGTCSAGECSCLDGFADCDGDPANGCEANLATDDANCNQCGTACNFLNAFDQCNNGVCEVTFCVPGFDNCDAAPGCETEVNSDTECGACGNDCTSIQNTTASCQSDGGTDFECVVTACGNSFMDCSNGGTNADGCETNIETDAANCGNCFRGCETGGNSTGSCVAGECECSANFANCRGGPCDTDTQTDIEFCGDCSTNCNTLVTQGGAACNNGQCEAVCDSFNNGDCDANPLDCETDFTQVTDCGSCGNTCTATNGIPNCFNNGTTMECQTNCNQGFQSCDTDPETCETETDSDPANCGFCGNDCGAGATCNMGSCQGQILNATVGQDFSCLLRDNGNVACWGSNVEGQLGNSVTLPGTDSFAPILAASTAGDITELASGGQHSCAIGVLGTFCWGNNDAGQLGVSNGNISTSFPQTVQGGHTFHRISVGTDHSCAIDVFTQEAYCWGDDSRGQLGQGTSVGSSALPLAIPSASIPNPVEFVTAGDQFTCARTMTQDTYCWGKGTEGQLGLGTVADNATPIQISSHFPNFVSLGTTSACSIRNNGVQVLDCWGDDTLLQLGNGSPATTESSPTNTGISNSFQVSVGASHACMMTNPPLDSIYCWGDNSFGQSGQGNTVGPTASAVEVTELSGNASSLAQGPSASHVCVVTKNSPGKVMCWGDNTAGQVGLDPLTNTTVTTPTEVQ